MNMPVNQDLIERVFGHLRIEVSGGNKVTSKFIVTQGVRFIELAVAGRKLWEVPYIASRICGACSISHYITSVKALENALGIDVGEWIEDFRDALNMIQIAQNHVTHLAFMALPDYLGVNAFKALMRGNEVVRKLIELNAVCVKALKLLAGGVSNPRFLRIGGLSRYVTDDLLLRTAKHLSKARELVEYLVRVLEGLNLPEACEPSGYCIALKPRADYLTSSREVGTCLGGYFRIEDYSKYLNESSLSYSNSKSVLMNGRPVYVGPRARYALYGRLLKEYLGREAAVDVDNPFSNIAAKAYEVLYCISMAEDILEDLTYRSGRSGGGIKRCLREPSTGVAAIEAPRGLLIHKYVISPSGRVINSDIITPTEINARHIEESAAQLAESLIRRGIDERDVEAEVLRLVRAYDPCLPCAVHVTGLRGWFPWVSSR